MRQRSSQGHCGVWISDILARVSSVDSLSFQKPERNWRAAVDWVALLKNALWLQRFWMLHCANTIMTNKSTIIESAVCVENCCIYYVEQVKAYVISNGNIQNTMTLHSAQVMWFQSFKHGNLCNINEVCEYEYILKNVAWSPQRVHWSANA